MHYYHLKTTENLRGMPYLFEQNLSIQVFDTDLTFSLPDAFVDPPLQDGWCPPSLQLRRGCEMYLTHISAFVPFLRHSNFDVDHDSLLLDLSMLSLGYQYGDYPECNTSSGADPSTQCFHCTRTILFFSDYDRAGHCIQLNCIFDSLA